MKASGGRLVKAGGSSPSILIFLKMNLKRSHSRSHSLLGPQNGMQNQLFIYIITETVTCALDKSESIFTLNWILNYNFSSFCLKNYIQARRKVCQAATLFDCRKIPEERPTERRNSAYLNCSWNDKHKVPYWCYALGFRLN